jgi:hypothetical protein
MFQITLACGACRHVDIHDDYDAEEYARHWTWEEYGHLTPYERDFSLRRINTYESFTVGHQVDCLQYLLCWERLLGNLLDGGVPQVDAVDVIVETRGVDRREVEAYSYLLAAASRS